MMQTKLVSFFDQRSLCRRNMARMAFALCCLVLIQQAIFHVQNDFRQMICLLVFLWVTAASIKMPWFREHNYTLLSLSKQPIQAFSRLSSSHKHCKSFASNFRQTITSSKPQMMLAQDSMQQDVRIM